MTQHTPTIPETIDTDWCVRQAATLLIEANSPIVDSDARGRAIELASMWIALVEATGRQEG